MKLKKHYITTGDHWTVVVSFSLVIMHLCFESVVTYWAAIHNQGVRVLTSMLVGAQS